MLSQISDKIPNDKIKFKKDEKNILIKGARVHNLKNVDLEIGRNKLVVITGVSGSGKSSLAIDTLFAEGQRRYVESLSAYARQFLVRMNKPDVDYIKGLSPRLVRLLKFMITCACCMHASEKLILLFQEKKCRNMKLVM